MRTATRVISVGLCLGVSVPLAAAPAIAASPTTSTAMSKVLTSTWFWNKAVDPPSALPVAVPPAALPPTIPSGFPATDVAVGAKGDPSGNPDKETYLAFDLAKFGPRSVIDHFTFSFPIDTTNATNVANGVVPLEACLPTRIWSGGPDGANWSDKPPDDCTAPALGVYDAAKKVYTFEVSAIIQNSIGGQNLGVAIRHQASYKSTFQIGFKTTPTIVAAVSYHQLPDDVSTTVKVAPVLPPPLVNVPASGGGGGGDFGGVLGALPAAAPAQANPLPLVGHELTPATSLAPFRGDTRLGKQFWLASLLGALGVLAIGLVLGQRPKVAIATAKSTRLSRVLSARAAALAATTPAARRGISHS